VARRARLLWDAGSSKSSFSEIKTIAAGAAGRQKTKRQARRAAVLFEGGTRSSNPSSSAGASVLTGDQPRYRLRTPRLGGGLRVGWDVRRGRAGREPVLFGAFLYRALMQSDLGKAQTICKNAKAVVGPRPGAFRGLPEPKAQVAFDVDQDPRPPSQAHCIDQPAVAGPTMIGDLEPDRDLSLEGAQFACRSSSIATNGRSAMRCCGTTASRCIAGSRSTPRPAA
jgi:hypothetical protein